MNTRFKRQSYYDIAGNITITEMWNELRIHIGEYITKHHWAHELDQSFDSIKDQIQEQIKEYKKNVP